MDAEISSGAIEVFYEPIHAKGEERRKEMRVRQRAQQRREAVEFLTAAGMRFIRRHGILLIGAVFLAAWTYGWCAYTANAVEKTINERLTAEYEDKYHAWIAEQEAARIQAAQAEAATQPDIELQREADSLARLIGPMETRQMKLTMIWNVFMRVDSPYFPNSVTECVEQPSQWMFYNSANPIRADDWDLAMEQLTLWHDGRYPAGIKNTFLYGEWSEGDYVLRDRWDKTDRTVYWRYPEV